MKNFTKSFDLMKNANFDLMKFDLLIIPLYYVSLTCEENRTNLFWIQVSVDHQSKSNYLSLSLVCLA
jgi:hypothetical protein